ncbi:DUF91 domain-containing protein, partial [Vibrio parahaemolyticus]|nr:DUF91 domain-containing protein [Vibrio parahaemolyticus]
MTNNLRVIQHAWHFWFESNSVITVFNLSLWQRASHLN